MIEGLADVLAAFSLMALRMTVIWMLTGNHLTHHLWRSSPSRIQWLNPEMWFYVAWAALPWAHRDLDWEHPDLLPRFVTGLKRFFYSGDGDPAYELQIHAGVLSVVWGRVCAITATLAAVLKIAALFV